MSRAPFRNHSVLLARVGLSLETLFCAAESCLLARNCAFCFDGDALLAFRESLVWVLVVCVIENIVGFLADLFPSGAVRGRRNSPRVSPGHKNRNVIERGSC